MKSNRMNTLIELLGDGHARTIRMLADELDTTESDVLRQIEYLEHIGIIKKVIGGLNTVYEQDKKDNRGHYRAGRHRMRVFGHQPENRSRAF